MNQDLREIFKEFKELLKEFRELLGDFGQGAFDGSILLLIEVSLLFGVGAIYDALGQHLLFNVICGIMEIGDYSAIAKESQVYIIGFLAGDLFILTIGGVAIRSVVVDMIAAFIIVLLILGYKIRAFMRE